ncbi:MAG: hypothetical protein HKN31_10120 [Pricia sp.]|nr:hypothetical protein [Pricia sp.]
MALTSTDPTETVQQNATKNSLEKLTNQLYDLKAKFETNYYGNTDCKKYDKARDFTIHINSALYEANKMSTVNFSQQIHLQQEKNEFAKTKGNYTRNSTKNCARIKIRIRKLKRELKELIA